MESLFNKAKPFLGVFFIQTTFGGMDILSKVALNQGLSSYVFVVYRQAVAFIVIAPFAFLFERNKMLMMTMSVFLKIVLLSILAIGLGQNMFLLGMKYTTATLAAIMVNVLPAVTFLMALCFGIERVNLMSFRGQAKVVGTVATIAGAMVMTLVLGPNLNLPWTKSTNADASEDPGNVGQVIKGCMFMAIGCLSWSLSMIVQAITLKTYPFELSLTAWICLLGTAEGAAVALIAEKGNNTAWALKWYMSCLAVVYSGVFCSGITYYVQGVVMKERGPVFVTAFSPLGMVITAALSTFILSEQMYLGRVLGAILIVMGLYLVVWGKKNDYKSPVEVEKTGLPESVSTGNV